MRAPAALLVAALLVAAPALAVAVGPAPSASITDDGSDPVAGTGAGTDGTSGAPTVPQSASTTLPYGGSIATGGASTATATTGDASTATPATGDASTATATTAPNGSNETRVMAIPDGAVQRSTVRWYAVDVGAAAGFGSNASAARITTAAVVARVENASTDEERAERIRDAMAQVRRQTRALQDRQASALAAFNAGRITAREFLVRLASIRLEAAALRDRIATLQRLADDTDGIDLSGGSVVATTFELRVLDGPVRQRVAAAMSGHAPPTRVYVETGPQGVVLATIDDGTYVREGYRGAVRDDGSATIDPEDALNVTARSYPEIWRTRTTQGAVIGPGSIYVTTVDHERGELTAFVDADSKQVFKEYQRRPLSSFVNRSSAVTVRSGLRLAVNRTYPGGPLRINVTDLETGEPVNATIIINVGPTRTLYVGPAGDDGTAWALSPRGSYEVTAVADGGTRVAVVQVRATEPPTLER